MFHSTTTTTTNRKRLPSAEGQLATVRRGGGLCRQLLRWLGFDRLAGSNPPHKKKIAQQDYEFEMDKEFRNYPSITEPYETSLL